MTELGLAFDDDDLDTHKKKHLKDKDLPYHVKIVAPRWFDQAIEELDCPGQEPQTLKFRGDYRYRLKDYAGAVEQYKAALDVLPENNVAVSQDVRESLSRCYAFLGKYNEGLKLSKDMVREMSTEDEARQRQCLMLLAFVCEKACLWEECVQTLQRLCLLQPNYPQTWFQLGDAMLKLIHRPNTNFDQIPSDDTQRISTSNPAGVQNKIAKDQEMESQLFVIMMCYVRAKFLFESVMANASNIIKLRNQRIIAEIEEKMKNLSLSEDLKQQARENVPRHIEIQVGDASSDENAEHKNKVFEHGDISDLFYKSFHKLQLNAVHK